MAKKQLKGSIIMAPLPAVMVTVGNIDTANIITIAWTGVICSNPPRVYISVRKERFSYDFLQQNGEFVINLVSEKLLASADFCGIRSGRDCSKFVEMKLTPVPATHVQPPLILQSPINLECKVFDVIPLGSHDMFLADVLAVHVNDEIVTDSGKIDLALAKLVNYQNGEYYSTGRHLGRFGFAAQRKFIAQNGKGLDVDLSKATLTKRKPPKRK